MAPVSDKNPEVSKSHKDPKFSMQTFLSLPLDIYSSEWFFLYMRTPGYSFQN